MFMRSVNELKEKIKHDLDDQIECVMIELCSGFHPLSDFVKECYKPEHADKVVELTKENVIAEMQEYIDFAFEKAHDMRGISANRSMWKFQQWLWVLEDEEIDCTDFYDYGIQNLERIVKKYGLKLNEHITDLED